MNELPDHLKKYCLTIISNPPVRNRIKNELLNLINIGNIDPQSISIEKRLFVEDKIYCIINIANTQNNKYYKFIITNSYPFSAPKLELQYKPYNYYLNFYSNDFKKLFYKYKRISCFCCYSKMCYSNWSPAVTLLDIINETIDFHNQCREIADRVIVDVIKRKYLIDDIDIINWLYF